MYDPKPKWWHAQHTSRLQQVEKKFRELHGRNPALPAWGDRPRSGAYWTLTEQVDLRVMLDEISGRDPFYHEKPMWLMAELAWIHGRSAVAIENELQKIMGMKLFLERFPRD